MERLLNVGESRGGLREGLVVAVVLGKLGIRFCDCIQGPDEIAERTGEVTTAAGGR